eukprot:m.482958 g.482958  ORF g.482958 m.482958 type:complete len:167 (+) comp22729_c0_seq1:174-674(+)
MSGTTYARLIAAMAALNIIVYICRGAIAGSVFNDLINNYYAVAPYVDRGPLVEGLLYASVYSCVAGVAHTMIVFMHVRTWNEVTRLTSVATGWIALGFSITAAGYAMKQYDEDIEYPTEDNFDSKMEALAALGIFQFLGQLLLLLLVLFLRSSQQSFSKMSVHGIV